MGVCEEHGKMMADIGHIKGTLEMILLGQTALFTKIERMAEKDVLAKVQAATNFAETKKETAIDRTRLKPVYWVITVIGGFVVLKILELIYKSFLLVK